MKMKRAAKKVKQTKRKYKIERCTDVMPPSGSFLNPKINPEKVFRIFVNDFKWLDFIGLESKGTSIDIGEKYQVSGVGVFNANNEMVGFVSSESFRGLMVLGIPTTTVNGASNGQTQ